MKRIVLVLLLIGTLMTVSAQDDIPAERPLLLAHYMPWYQTPDVSGSWGWHWTMEHFNPYKKDDTGRREIASHYMPLTGAYDSSDEAVLDYQMLLMKLSGIDGVIVDWYGTSSFRDYGIINDATLKLFAAVQRAGLKFILCYEDQTALHMVNGGALADFNAAVAQGAADMQFAQEHFFSDPAYVTRDGRPLLYVFGPQYFRSAANWDAMFEGLPAAPLIVALNDNLAFGSASNYPWPPMHFAGGAELLPTVLDVYLDQFYRNAQRKSFITTSAFPAFHDIYEEAGVRSSYGYLDPADGEILRHTLERAVAVQPEIIQLVTWNDYGEGTIIEPTEEFGYDRLAIVQATRASIDPSFTAQPDALPLPLRWFQLRRAHAKDAAITAQLDAIYDALLAGDTASATALLAVLEGA